MVFNEVFRFAVSTEYFPAFSTFHHPQCFTASALHHPPRLVSTKRTRFVFEWRTVVYVFHTIFLSNDNRRMICEPVALPRIATRMNPNPRKDHLFPATM